MSEIVVTTTGNDDFVEHRMIAAIRLREMRGRPQLYKYNGNLLQNRLVAGSKLPRATQVIAGRKVLFAGKNKKFAGGK